MAELHQEIILYMRLAIIVHTIQSTPATFTDTNWKWCSYSKFKLETFWGISVQNCVEKCDVTLHCSSVNYLTTSKLCELLTNDSTPTNDESIQRPCRHIRRQNLLSKQSCIARGDNCIHKACPVLDVENADMLGNILTVGSRVEVKCHTGYTLNNARSPIRCGEDGQWTSVPTCRVVCPDPPHVRNAAVSPGNNSIGEVRRYSCLPGSVLQSEGGSVTTECLYNKTWTSTHFQCLIDCGEPVNMTNVVIGPGNTTETSERYYKCNKGYITTMRTTYHTTTCQSNGTWSSSTCVKNADRQDFAKSFTFGFINNFGFKNHWIMYAVSPYPTRLRITTDLQTHEDELEVNTGAQITLHKSSIRVLENSLFSFYVTGTCACGFHLQSDDPVYIYVENAIDGSTDASVVIPDEHLSTDYALVSWSHSTYFDSEFSVVAKFDNTDVEIVFVNGSRYQETLDGNQMYHYLQKGDITGILVSASEVVAVFAGHECTNVITPRCDHLYAQMPPIKNLQVEFIVSFPYPRHLYVVRILAVEDNTGVRLSNGNSETLNHKEYAQFEFDALAIGITSTKKVMVAAYSLGRESRPNGFPSTYDGSMLIVPGLSQFKPEYNMFVPEDVVKCMLMVTFPSHASNIDDLRLNHKYFLAIESVEVNVDGRGMYTVLYTEVQKGTSVIYTTDGTPFGAYLSFFREGAESWFSLSYNFSTA